MSTCFRNIWCGASSRPIRTRSWFRAGCRISIPVRSCRWSTSSIPRWTPCAEASGLRDRRHRPFGDRRAQQRQHDRKAQSRADDRVRAGRAFIGLAFRSVVVMFACILPGHFPGGAVGHGAVAARGGAAIRQRRCADGVVRPGLSATIHFLNRLRLETTPGVSPELAVERATVLVGPALDPDHGGAGLRPGGDGVFRSAVAAPVRLAQRVRDVAALVADLFILRPTAMFLINLSPDSRHAIWLPRQAGGITEATRSACGVSSSPS
jgi:hypothetical protein